MPLVVVKMKVNRQKLKVVEMEKVTKVMVQKDMEQVLVGQEIKVVIQHLEQIKRER